MADHCEHCPMPDGCPCWIGPQAGFIERNAAGEERFITGCFYQVIPRLMVEVIAASVRPAAAIESTRNEIIKGLGRIAWVMNERQALPQVLDAISSRVDDAKTERG